MGKYKHEKESPNFLVIRLIVIAFVVVLVFLLGMYTGIKYSMRTMDMQTTGVEVKEQAENIIQQETVATKESQNDSTENQNKDDNNGLKEKLLNIINEKYPEAKWAFVVKNMETGDLIEHNGYEKKDSASLIKLFIMEKVLNDDSFDLTEKREKKLERMITESHNQSANDFIDYYGGTNENRKVTEENGINKYIVEQGYESTELNRKMYDVPPKEGSTGYTNYTSAYDVSKLLEKIYVRANEEDSYGIYALNLLKNQQRREKIPAIISKEEGIVVANKTGELNTVENDAAIIMSDELDIVLVVMSEDVPSTEKKEVRDVIAKLAKTVVDYYREVE